MKFILSQFLLAFFFLSFLSCRTVSSDDRSADGVSGVAEPSPTVVYVVRHAEKDTLDPANKDPDLTPAGKARGEALKQLLEGEQVSALFATKYIRTQNTLKPLAEARNLDIIQYEASDFNGLKEQVLQNHSGETVVVAGHSNTILPILEAFGVERPVPDISEAEYNYIFKLIINADKTATVEVGHYGQ